MSAYVDTSVLVAALSNEAATDKAQSWLATQPAGGLLLSDWTATEFSSALSIQLRTGQIDLAQRADSLALFRRLVAESFIIVTIGGTAFQTAARFADQHLLGLRAGEALHLAAASEAGASLCTLDRRLAEAGPELGIPTHLLA